MSDKSEHIKGLAAALEDLKVTDWSQHVYQPTMTWPKQDELMKQLEDLHKSMANYSAMQKASFDEVFTDMLSGVIVDDPTGDGLKWLIKLRENVYKKMGWTNEVK